MKANDPKLYRAMAEPLGDKVAAEARLEEFAKEVEQLRIKHHNAERHHHDGLGLRRLGRRRDRDGRFCALRQRTLMFVLGDNRPRQDN